MSRCGLFIVANIQSEITGTGDPEESTLKQRAYNMLSALTLSCKFTSNRDPWLVTGSFGSKGLEVHSHEELLPSRGSIVVNPKAIGTDQVVFAGRIAKALGSLDGPWDDGNWRFLRCLSVYDAGRRDADALEQIHQFVRCVEGLICAKAGDGTKNSKAEPNCLLGHVTTTSWGALRHAQPNRTLTRTSASCFA